MKKRKTLSKKPLTYRQRMTYNFIRDTFINENRAVSQREVYENYPYHPIYRKDGYKWKENGTHDKCAAVWRDINTINLHPEIEKIIISDEPWQYRLARNKEEVERYAHKLYFSPAIKKLERYWNMINKAEMHGRGKLLGVTGKPIDKTSQAREFIEAFISEEKDLD